MNISPYESRPIRFLELWRTGEWRLKVYGIAYRRPGPRPELIDAAKTIATQRLASVPRSIGHYAVGFLAFTTDAAQILFFWIGGRTKTNCTIMSMSHPRISRLSSPI